MRCYKKFILIFTLFIIILFWRMKLGEWDIPFYRAVHFLLSAQPDEINLPEYIIIREIRLPRFLSSPEQFCRDYYQIQWPNLTRLE